MDVTNYYFLTCYHENVIINYLNLASKWFLSRCYQTNNAVNWYNFNKSIVKLLYGEKKDISDTLKSVFYECRIKVNEILVL